MNSEGVLWRGRSNRISWLLSKGAKASCFVPSLFLTWSWKVKALVYARVDSKRVFGTIYCPNKFGKHWITQSWLAVGFSEPLMCKCVVLVSSFRDVSLAKRTVNQAVCRRGSSPSTKHLRLICHFPTYFTEDFQSRCFMGFVFWQVYLGEHWVFCFLCSLQSFCFWVFFSGDRNGN